MVLQGIIDSNTEIPTDEGKVSIKWIDNAPKVAFDNDTLIQGFQINPHSLPLMTKPSELHK